MLGRIVVLEGERVLGLRPLELDLGNTGEEFAHIYLRLGRERATSDRMVSPPVVLSNRAP
jgi:hypothetical protein